MKKSQKKLTLHRETLSSLDTGEWLRWAVGRTAAICDSFDTSCKTACHSCRVTICC